MPDTQDLMAIHARLLVSDRTGTEALVSRLCNDAARAVVQRRFPRADPHDVLESLHEATLEYLQQPWRFNPGRGASLQTYVLMVAMRNLLNLMRAAQRRRMREAVWAGEQLRLASLDTAEAMIVAGDATLETGLADLSQIERRAVITWLNGETRTQALANLLGASNLSIAEQRRYVKRFKDRMVKRILRRTVRSSASQ